MILEKTTCCGMTSYWNPPLELTVTEQPDDPDGLFFKVSLTDLPGADSCGETTDEAIECLGHELSFMIQEPEDLSCFTEFHKQLKRYLFPRVSKVEWQVPETMKFVKIEGQTIIMEITDDTRKKA